MLPSLLSRALARSAGPRRRDSPTRKVILHSEIPRTSDAALKGCRCTGSGSRALGASSNLMLATVLALSSARTSGGAPLDFFTSRSSVYVGWRSCSNPSPSDASLCTSCRSRTWLLAVVEVDKKARCVRVRHAASPTLSTSWRTNVPLTRGPHVCHAHMNPNTSLT
jgi:hypothetical protein